MNSNKFGIHEALDNFYLLELLKALADSRTRLKSIKGYTEELQAVSNKGNSVDIANKLHEYTPIMKLLNNDVEETIDISIDYLNIQKPWINAPRLK